MRTGIKQTVTKDTLLAMRDGLVSAPSAVVVNQMPTRITRTRIIAAIDCGQHVVILWEGDIDAKPGDDVEMLAVQGAPFKEVKK